MNGAFGSFVSFGGPLGSVIAGLNRSNAESLTVTSDSVIIFDDNGTDARALVDDNGTDRVIISN